MNCIDNIFKDQESCSRENFFPPPGHHKVNIKKNNTKKVKFKITHTMIS